MRDTIRRTFGTTTVATACACAAALLALVAPVTPARAAAPAAAPAADEKVEYNRDVRPILSDNCFYCHGPDKSHRKAKLRLDERESAIKLEAIVPGKPEASLLVERILTNDPDELMPPPESHKKLTDKQKDVLKRWVAQGAEYQPHWAYITPARPPVPQVANAAWVRNPVDAFVLRTLEAKKLTPSKEADRRTLLRRLTLDLTGVPPTPAEVEAFVNDKAPDAYERQVDRLLASPRYGERMAVPWLDAVRFADTVGFHGDQNQNVFPYRDYVISAFNGNKPFDRFVTEQLAGDLLPNQTTEQLVATGFNRLNMMTREGGAQPKEYLAIYAGDRVRTVGSALLGSTIGCAECHDHKFDPFTAKDFYALAAYFADVRQWGVYHDYGYTPNPDLKGWSNDHPFPPEIVVDSPYLKAREERIAAQMDQVAAAAGKKLLQDPTARAAFEAWRDELRPQLARGVTWAPLGGSAPSGAVAFKTKPGTTDRVELKLPAGHVAAILLDVRAPDSGLTLGRDGTKSATVQMSAAVKPAAGGKEAPLPVWYAEGDPKDAKYANGYAILGIHDAGGWRVSGDGGTAVYLLDRPFRAAEGDTLALTFNKNTLAMAEVAVTSVAPLNPLAPHIDDKLLERLQRATRGADDPAIWRAYLLNTDADAEVQKQLRALQREVFECRNGKSPTLVTEAVAKPMVTRVLPRGNWQDESGEVVQPAPPHFLPQPKADRRQTRLDLANWLVSPENPLTARVFVNRTWKQFFGAGLCNSVEDLGAQGESPSHPELLDWLAVEFREPTAGGAQQEQRQPWDVKHVVRLIVTSSAYRQDSNPRPELRDVDPANRLLASQTPRRLEAEFVRDNALFAAGLLNLADVGGPSFKPYQPDGYYANIQFPDRPYAATPDDRQWRRGLYVHWQRTFLQPMMANFDAPSREDTACTRNVSNTPQQALTLLNDPTFVEAARVMAQQVLSQPGGDAERLDAVYQRALARAPKAKERESLGKFLAAQRECYRAAPDDAKKIAKAGIAPPPAAGIDEVEVAAWTNVCRVVLNLHETITRY